MVMSMGLLSAALLFAKHRRESCLEVQKERLEAARAESKELQKFVDSNRMWAVRVAVLETSLLEGKESIDALAALKAVTPEEMRLLECNVKRKRVSVSSSPQAVRRWLYVRGLIRSPERASVGEEILGLYTDELRKHPLFDDTKILPRYVYGNDQIHFEMRINLRVL